MALVPAGCFIMGSEDGKSDEQPSHEVCFDQPYWIDVVEVTNQQYGSPSTDCVQWSSGDTQPRICIDWFESVAFCESRGGRLLTEAEWAYAARGPDGLEYPWGNSFLAENVVNSGSETGQTAEVGSIPAGQSWVGALDLSGNVWEWVSDWYADSYPAERQIDPVGPDDGDYRVLRGGTWTFHNVGDLRSAVRIWLNPARGDNLNGFRCARDYQPGDLES